MEAFQHFLEGNLTAIVALVVAIISGVFSIIATNRSSRPQMVQPYLQYLMNKVDTLTKHISYGNNDDIDISSKEGQVKAVKAMRDVYNYKESVFLNESELFTECKSQYAKLIPKREAIDKSNSYQALVLQFKDNLDQVNLESLQDAPYKDFHSFTGAMIDFTKEMDALMRAEKAATLKLVRDISLK